MYMAWVKPYLRNIQRMTMNQDFFDSPDMIAAFETAMMEVEFIATSDPHDYDGYHPIVLASFQFRTRPDMSVRKEYQQGPVHLGKMDLSVRAYAWTPEQLSAYRAMKRREEIELLSVLDTSLRDIMDSLGEDFEVYLKEVGEEVDEKPKPVVLKKEQPGALAPFMGVAFGLKELVSGLNPLPSKPKDDHGHGHGKLGKPGKAMSVASFKAGQIYHVFKKQKRLVTW